jgi:hypothetical protein
MDGKISEKRACCKIRAQLWFPPIEIHADLQKVYGKAALKYTTVCKWVCPFNDGRESPENWENISWGRRTLYRAREKN